MPSEVRPRGAAGAPGGRRRSGSQRRPDGDAPAPPPVNKALRDDIVKAYKAFVATESRDLLINETKGDIAGIAQIGAGEAKEAGGDPKDRLDPSTAIPLAAKVLVKKAQQRERGPGCSTISTAR
jgi:hypothetical protein